MIHLPNREIHLPKGDTLYQRGYRYLPKGGREIHLPKGDTLTKGRYTLPKGDTLFK